MRGSHMCGSESMEPGFRAAVLHEENHHHSQSIGLLLITTRRNNYPLLYAVPYH
ncbi:predicted protein [Plenodomus lingam JN3]|uniref:Uncharacterized protein n=1 Tax=Leptosphaeria maculans (strain JN3 / isolate v23.1.3 / race Av1-4-5-6-7-8) TaxID=985895 RepID=E4ZGG0_LEPMJ|nr:predicted protein [Plenodomus lingam JN3]CBX90380.1 predicted protein [Plenodomus lingam JN3]